MKKKPWPAIILAILCTVFFLGAGCGTEVSGGQDNPIKIWAQNRNGTYETLVVVDDETGVNYIVVSGELHGDPRGTAITPRLNKDGSLYIK